jgi:predicted dehydrogenase
MMITKPDHFSLDTSRPYLRPHLGFLGADWQGLSRIETIVQSGIAEVVAVAEPSDQQRDYAEMIAPNAQMTASFNDLVRSKIDGIIISNPNLLSTGQLITLLEKGTAVFSDKPFGRTQAEMEQIVRAARKANRLLSVDFSYRYTSAMQAARQAVQSGELGKIYAVNLTFHNAFEPNTWFHSGKISRNTPHSEGCVTDLGSSLIDMALWALDFPKVAHVNSRLYAKGQPIKAGNAKAEDFATAQIVLENDTVMQMSCGWNLSTGCDSILRADFYGTRGGVSFHNMDGSFHNFIADRFYGSRRETMIAPLEQWDGRALMEWVRRISMGGRYNPEADRYVDVATALEAVYKAAV